MLTAQLGGCGINPGSGQCTETTLTAPPITVTDPLAPLTVMATLTAKGKPVAGGDVDFFVIVVSATGARGLGSGGGLGHTPTGPDGVARIVRKGGIDGLVFGTDRLTGYGADFIPLNKINGVQYCKTRVESPVTVE